MLLRSTLTSPFGRKVRLAATRLRLIERMRIEPADPLDAADVLRHDNPLGKMPLLVLDDGRRLYDSRVILEHLDHLMGGGALLPRDWESRFDALPEQALADGIMDAAILVVYESRHRPKEIRHEPWLAYQGGKIERALDAFAAHPPDPEAFHVGTITLACALGYLDWRKQVDWRSTHAALVAWLDRFRANVPEFDATKAES